MPEINNLFRRVRNLPLYIKENGTISSAIYSDSKGVSVDVDDNRELSDIIADEERLHILYNKENIVDNPDGPYKLVAIAAVKKTECDEKSVYIEPAPIEEENLYHAILKKNENEIVLSASQRKYLAKKSKIVKTYDEDLIIASEM